MTKLTLEQQELLFANDCKLINLRYEYHGYTGTEKWGDCDRTGGRRIVG